MNHTQIPRCPFCGFIGFQHTCQSQPGPYPNTFQGIDFQHTEHRLIRIEAKLDELLKKIESMEEKK